MDRRSRSWPSSRSGSCRTRGVDVLGMSLGEETTALAREMARELERTSPPDLDPTPSPLRAQDLPLDYMDKLCLAGTSVEHTTSAAPVWQLHIDGVLDPGEYPDKGGGGRR